MPYQQHLSDAASIIVRCAVITLSDTRTGAADISGQKIVTLLKSASHSIMHYEIVEDEPAAIDTVFRKLFNRDDVDLILTNGGTGISTRDQTITVVEKLIEQPLPGFGELFRMLSYQQVGSGAMLSRAVAGIARGKLVFSMPGSPAAVELAMTKLILPEMKHLLREMRKS